MVTPAFVLDCSVTIAWCLNEPNTYAERVAESMLDTRALAPAIWTYEVANALVMAERRKRITVTEREELVGVIDALDIAVEPAPNAVPFALAALAQQYRLSVYDAAYLDLAIRHGLPLATIDGNLARAAEQAQLPRLAL